MPLPLVWKGHVCNCRGTDGTLPLHCDCERETACIYIYKGF
jgi:hypothetical protein